jgi:uncharacterized radical SAM protein YgiQ
MTEPARRSGASRTGQGLFSHRPYWAHRFGVAPFLPASRAEMDELGWDSCDVILVTGDAYIDHPSFGMALVGRLLERHGFRVGILDQPDWRSAEPFRALGRPNLMWGVTAGNMDSMVNRYTSDRKIRRDDAYTPDGAAGGRPDRSVLVYAGRCREAFGDVPVVIGGIEASLRRIAHYDYWSDKVRRSVLVDAKADLLVYGNAERAIVELAHRIAAGTPIDQIRDLRGTAHARPLADFVEVDSTSIDRPGQIAPLPDPYAMESERAAAPCATGEADPSGAAAAAAPLIQLSRRRVDRARTVLRLPSFEQVASDPALYAHASRILHLESNPGNARALVQRHGAQDVWINPPPLPLSTAEMDELYELPFQRVPHPRHGSAKIPAYEMIKHSVTILRGCFGGCSFCSITEHEGRVIQSRSEGSILREIERIRDRTPGFHGIISDLGGPTANMYRMACKSREIEAACRKPSCVYPDICDNLGTDHGPLVALYRKARAIPGVRSRQLNGTPVASGVENRLDSVMMILCGLPCEPLTSRKPSAPEPPLRLITTTDSFISLYLAMMPWIARAIWSAPPPVPAGTMNSTVLLGSHACAAPSQPTARAVARTRQMLLLITPPVRVDRSPRRTLRGWCCRAGFCLLPQPRHIDQSQEKSSGARFRPAPGRRPRTAHRRRRRESPGRARETARNGASGRP